MTGRLTKAQRALAKCVLAMDRRFMTLADARRYGLEFEFNLARRAGLIRSAGYEASAKGDDWLDSPAGRRALAREQGE